MRETRRAVLAGAAASAGVAATGAQALPDRAREIMVGDVAVRCVRYGRGGGRGTPLLYVHGGTFPSELAVGWSFSDQRSWADDLVAAGHDLWAFDFAGFGRSDRYAAMATAPVPGPLGRSDAAVGQLARVADHVRAQTGAKQITLLAHSWGGLVACRYAAEQPQAVSRLVLYAPILKRTSTGLPDPATLPSWTPMTLQAQLKRFREDAPAGEPELIAAAEFSRWGASYLASDPTSGARSPESVAIPVGPQADIVATWSGKPPYDPARITCPVAVVRGAWDSLCTDADVEAFQSTLVNTPSFRDARLERGTHLMLLETGRTRLWTAVRNALADGEGAPLDTHAVLFEVRPKATGRADYLAAAAALRPLLDEVDGFGSIERFASAARPDWILSLSYWADEAALAAWRSNGRHHSAQAQGRTSDFQDYRIRVARTESDSAVAAARQPPGRSTYRRAGRSVRRLALVETVGDLPPDLAALFGAGGERFESLTRPGRSVHLLALEAAATGGPRDQALTGALQAARAGGFAGRLRVLEVLRDYGMYDRAEAPQFFAPSGGGA